MKILKILIILGILVQTFSCKGEKNGEIKLLETRNYGDGLSTKYEYDSKNRIVKLITTQGGDTEDITTLTYNGDDLVTVTSTESNRVKKFERKANVIYVNDGEPAGDFTLDKNGFIIERDSKTYQYANGNLIKEIDGDKVTEYKYDDKKYPYQCNTPKWVIQYLLFDPTAASKNNVIEEKYYDGTATIYKYQYDSDGFPTDKSWSSPAGDEWWNGFVYRKK